MSADQSRHTLLQECTRRLCNAFAESARIEQLEKLFVEEPTIIEHGPHTPSVPFLGTFSGANAVQEYMAILARTLTVSNASYSAPIVDAGRNMVSVKGKGHFAWQEGIGKGIEWHEEFVYILEFDERGRVIKWEIWADPLNAWLASQGKKLDD